MIEALIRSGLPFALGVMGIVYVLTFVPLYSTIGIEAAALSALLVAGVGWLRGLWAGLFAGMLTLPLHLFLLNFVGQTTWESRLEFLVWTPILAGIGVTVGCLRKFTRELAHQALYDPLTQLPTRALFSDRLEHALARAMRHKEPIAVLFLGLDNFKIVNDGLGHKAGDQLLMTVAKCLRNHLRPEDTFARLGGDTFIILLEDVANANDAIQAAQRIEEVLRAPFILEGQEVCVTISIGISLSTSGQNQPEDLLRDAHRAMYRAKTNGKAGYEVFDPSMRSRALERLKLENDLRRAIERGELRVYYQPVVQLKTGRVFAMEALARWEHPERGLVLPSEFIPIAQESGLIIPLGQWVMKESCRQARQWHEQSPDSPPLEVSVNLSTKQFQNVGLVEDIARKLRETGLDPGTLVLEITESLLLEDAPQTIATLERFKSLGVKLAIDDFGTGYSSLSYLKRFSADYLKIDRSIIEDLEQDPKNAAIVSAAITLAHALDAQAIAEGVENYEQLKKLRELECDAGQGSYFGEPCPSEATIESFLETLMNKLDEH